MSRVITFSTAYPAYHPKKGQPTYFIEKCWRSLVDNGINEWDFAPYEYEYNQHFPCKYTPEEQIKNHTGKHHTIRAGNRWKVGDKFSPRVWSGRPYNTPQVTIAPDIEIKKVWKFEIYYFPDEDILVPMEVFIDDRFYCEIGSAAWNEIASNDGLTGQDLTSWVVKKNFKFIKGVPIFSGQIICWNENINY